MMMMNLKLTRVIYYPNFYRKYTKAYFYNKINLCTSVNYIPYGLVVRIPAFHAGGPGSIPGVGIIF